MMTQRYRLFAATAVVWQCLLFVPMLILVVDHYPCVCAFSTTTTTTTNPNVSERAAKATASTAKQTLNPEIRYYTHHDYRLSYRYWGNHQQQPLSLSARHLPVLLIHPVGIGQGSWYWDNLCRTMQQQQQRSCFAVNLLGCGLQDGGDAWTAPSSSSFHQLLPNWVTACQALMQQEMKLTTRRNCASKNPSFFDHNAFLSMLSGKSGPAQTPKHQKRKKLSNQCHIVVQGGLAPLGFLLAARNPDTIASLTLTSPPPFKEVSEPLPNKDIQSSLDFLTSRTFGDVALNNLESKWAIELFSNLFLFDRPCDPVWIQECLHEATRAARPPVIAFNAGECRRDSVLQVLLPKQQQQQQQTAASLLVPSVSQPTLIVQGKSDTKQRIQGRQAYAAENGTATTQTNCRIETLSNGKSVLPWECPQETLAVLSDFWQHIETQS